MLAPEMIMPALHKVNSPVIKYITAQGQLFMLLPQFGASIGVSVVGLDLLSVLRN